MSEAKKAVSKTPTNALDAAVREELARLWPQYQQAAAEADLAEARVEVTRATSAAAWEQLKVLVAVLDKMGINAHYVRSNDSVVYTFKSEENTGREWFHA